MADGRISDLLMKTPVQGVNLRGASLGDALGDEPTLLVFLRHFGCPFCREIIADFRRLCAEKPLFPPPLFVYMGTPAQGAEFFGRAWPQARAIADPARYLYRKFQLERHGFAQMFAPQAVVCGLRAAVRGYLPGAPAGGDVWQTPGMFLIHGDVVRRRFEARHIADRPPIEVIERELAAAWAEESL